MTLPQGDAEELLNNLPAGAKVIECERAPSGHMMIPVDNWQACVSERHLALMADLPKLAEKGVS